MPQHFSIDFSFHIGILVGISTFDIFIKSFLLIFFETVSTSKLISWLMLLTGAIISSIHIIYNFIEIFSRVISYKRAIKTLTTNIAIVLCSIGIQMSLIIIQSLNYPDDSSWKNQLWIAQIMQFIESFIILLFLLVTSYPYT